MHGDSPVPTRLDSAWWRTKVTLHQLARALADLGPDRPLRHRPAASLRDAPILASSRSSLWSTTPGPEWILEAGKVENLRRASRALAGVEVGPRQTLSFWAQVGPPWKLRGFVEGREVREGCLIPSVAGGLCQLSNALYAAALEAELEIVERHAHSRPVPGTPAAIGRDATILWNYVDLRIRSPRAFRIDIALEPDTFVLTLRGYSPARSSILSTPSTAPEQVTTKPIVSMPLSDRSCLSCERHGCHRVRPTPTITRGQQAWLVDGWWPEFEAWMLDHRGEDDLLFMPGTGRRWLDHRYRWPKDGFARVFAHPVPTLLRSAASRRWRHTPSKRQRALLAWDRQLALAMARQLPYTATRLTVDISWLPHLWHAGVLGGRRFDVFATRPPLFMLQATLDRAAALHPQSGTLTDFRADQSWVALERVALSRAEHIITPHVALARELGPQAICVPWTRPPTRHRLRNTVTNVTAGRILFPASTLGRKGAYELRAALKGIDTELMITGPVLETSNFWQRPVRRGTLDEADLVVLPAHFEVAPRALLAALARGIPTIASKACGLGPQPGLDLVDAGDVVALRHSITTHMDGLTRSVRLDVAATRAARAP